MTIEKWKGKKNFISFITFWSETETEFQIAEKKENNGRQKKKKYEKSFSWYIVNLIFNIKFQ